MPWLALVAAAFTVTQLLFVVRGTGLGWDEGVYVSQVSPHTPTAFFSAPRARGVTFLAAPVVVLTASTEVLRYYLALLSGVGLFLAFRAWRRVLPEPVLALAGALFASLWVTLFYGPRVMPNLWVALGALAATGCFLRLARDGSDRVALVWLAASLAFVALMRPSDAFWLGLGLGCCALLVSRWRRPALLAVLVVGTVAGSLPWVVEAYTSYGGLMARLHRASEIQGSLGWYFALDDQVRSLQGRTLCRPCDVPWKRPVTGLWLFVLPLAVAVGVRAAIRRLSTALVVVPLVAGLSMAVPYLLMVGYAAPRFLLPAYALLSIPVAYGLIPLISGRRSRPVAAVLVTLGLTAHLVVQASVLYATTDRGRKQYLAQQRVVAELDRLGVRSPCVLTGDWAVPLGFHADCSSRQIGGHDGSITERELVEKATRDTVAVLVAGGDGPPAYARDWPERRLPPLPSLTDLRVYLSPAVPERAAPRG